MPVEVLSNSVGTIGADTLAADPGTGGTTLTLTAGHGARFAAVAAGQTMRLTVDDEVMVVTAHTAGADTMTVTRGQEGTTAAAHAVGAAVSVVLTRGSLMSALGIIDPTEYGAVGNGIANDTAALQAAIAALNPGNTLWIGPGKIYTHTAVLTIATGGVRITGGGELRATAEATSAVWLTGVAQVMDNIRLTCPTTTQRWVALEQHKLVLNQSTRTRLRAVEVDGAAGAGILMYGATYYAITECSVSNTRADGYHNVRASHHGVIDNCDAFNVGDDGFACVSYSSGPDPGITHHVRINNCRVEGSNAGRLFAVIGSQDIEYTGCWGKSSWAAGIIVGTETTVPTPSVARVTIRDMEIQEANARGSDTGRPDHGGVLVVSELAGQTVSDVQVRNVRLKNTRAGASRQTAVIVNAGGVSDVTLDDIKAQGSGPALPFFTNTAAANFRTYDVTGPTSGGWELIGQARLTAAAVSTGAITIPAYDLLMISVRVMGMSAADIPALRFNGLATNVYWTRFITSVAGGATLANVQTATTNMLRMSGVSTAATRMITAYVNNFQFWQKAVNFQGSVTTAAVATPAPIDVSGAGEWVNATDRVTSVELRTAGGTATMNADTAIMIFGKNVTV